MKYRKLPVVIEAIQLAGNREDVLVWIGRGGGRAVPTVDGLGIAINTLEGSMVASPTDWIIRGVKGEYYPCRADIFAATYEEGPE